MASCGFRTDIQQVFTPTEAELAENDPEVPFFLWKLRMQRQLQYSLIGDEQCITMWCFCICGRVLNRFDMFLNKMMDCGQLVILEKS